MFARVLTIFFLLNIFCKAVISIDSYEAYFLPDSLFIQQSESDTVKIGLNQSVPNDVTLKLSYWERNGDVVSPEKLNGSAILPIPDFVIKKNQDGPTPVTITGNLPGHIYLRINSSGSINIVNAKSAICRVTVVRLRWLNILQIVIGWLYFAAWTVSFYPQLYMNWRRKSVVGFNFDFAILNVIGFLYYSVYNIGLFWIPLIQEQYLSRNPLGTIPVLTNDVVFAFHAFIISSLTAFQILIYDRGDQRVSKLCIGLIILIAIYTIIVCIIGGANVVQWLDTFYLLSHVKLVISIVKYTPQAYMNFRRKSTVGWSIANIMLDFSGGILSIAQMIIIAYNNNDISSITGSPIKLGLGILSIAFDILFMVQHWCLYRHPPNQDFDVITVEEEKSDIEDPPNKEKPTP
ncbi:unnamed protein product [Trichobilharzia szidati]|nr:unnamed protein product [Trichobilharzia szidati]